MPFSEQQKTLANICYTAGVFCYFAQHLKGGIEQPISMSQEAITEIDMDVFSRRIGPYFSWLESKIEGGWQQNDSVQKDVLKEIKYLATTMRARFILGVSKEDFAKEVKRTLELFELASEAFPSESDEVESKQKHFCKGVGEELGVQFLPQEYQSLIPRPQPLDPHPFPGPEPMPGPEPEPGEPDEEKILKAKPIEAKKPAVKAPKIETSKEVKKVETPKMQAKPVKAKPKKIQKAKPVNAKKGKRKGFFIVRWVKGFIWGED